MSLTVHDLLYITMQGAQEVFRELPHQYVSPLELKDVVENGGTHVHNAYIYMKFVEAL